MPFFFAQKSARYGALLLTYSFLFEPGDVRIVAEVV